jgi:UDP-hydrolysing UDP-N-acetyl-D-glucosamine 2-epimerase
MSKALAGYADAYATLKPDMLVVLGDRYEILAAATAALIMRIPIAHISGGDVTEGAFDDAIRHSITKMSQLHFPSTEEYRRRVIQLGEQPDRVFNVGATGVENINNLSTFC